MISGGSYGSDEARSPRQNMQTEDMSGIERSGLRTIMDKQSDGIRKGIAKTFNFRGKRTDEKRLSIDNKSLTRAMSSATIRHPDHPSSPETNNARNSIGAEASEDASAAGSRWSPPQTIIHHSENSTPFTTDESNPFAISVRTSIQTQSLPLQPQRPPLTSQRSAGDFSGLHPPPPMANSLNGKFPPLPQLPVPPQDPPGPQIKRWIGNGKAATKWNKLRRDPELWDPNGDVLVYLCHKGESPRPPPSFRLSSHVIEATESRSLTTMLLEAADEESPWPASLHPHHRHADGISPIEEDSDGTTSYEMYFPPPYGLPPAMALRHHITTRNVFALLYHASLVGTTLYTALTDLMERLDNIMPPSSDNVGLVLGHMLSRGVDDVRGNASMAVSLMAWCEHPSVRWEEGWIEFFTHVVGMYSPEKMDMLEDWKWVSAVTKAIVDGSSLEEQVRVQTAEDRLADFGFSDLWEETSHRTMAMSKGVADRLSDMLVDYYTKAYGSWPPPVQAMSMVKSTSAASTDRESDEEDVWLNRLVAMNLAKDFGALYEYLVDREVKWDADEIRGQKFWRMVRPIPDGGGETEDVNADLDGFPMTKMMIDYDNSGRIPHVPHPYCLVPEPISPNGRGNLERRVHLAYMEATNVDSLHQGQQSDLVDAFMRFEKSDQPSELDPVVARRGRWVVIYGILQTLATVAVDAKEVRWRDGVPYHLCVKFGGRGRRVPPWRPSAASDRPDRIKGSQHEGSLCWVLSRKWAGQEEEEEDDDEDDEARRFEDEYGEYMGEDGKEYSEKRASQLKRRSSVGFTSIPTSTPSMTPDTSVSRNSSLARARSFSQPSRGRARTRSSHALPSPTPGKLHHRLAPPVVAPTIVSSNRAPSITSSAGSGFEAPVEWDILTTGKRPESRGRDMTTGSREKRSPSVPLMLKAEQVRGDSRPRGD